MADLERREHLGEVMPYERALIPHLEEINLEFREAFEDHNAGEVPPSTDLRKEKSEANTLVKTTAFDSAT